RLRARLVVVHVTQPSRGIGAARSRSHQDAVKALQLARALGAEVHTRDATNAAESIVEFSAEVGATQLVLGQSTHAHWWNFLRPSLLREVLRRTQDIDVHIVGIQEP